MVVKHVISMLFSLKGHLNVNSSLVYLVNSGSWRCWGPFPLLKQQFWKGTCVSLIISRIIYIIQKNLQGLRHPEMKCLALFCILWYYSKNTDHNGSCTAQIPFLSAWGKFWHREEAGKSLVGFQQHDHEWPKFMSNTEHFCLIQALNNTLDSFALCYIWQTD